MPDFELVSYRSDAGCYVFYRILMTKKCNKGHWEQKDKSTCDKRVFLKISLIVAVVKREKAELSDSLW